jgi:hypothetical protein
MWFVGSSVAGVLDVSAWVVSARANLRSQVRLDVHRRAIVLIGNDERRSLLPPSAR